MVEPESARYSGLIEAARQGDAECRDRLFGLCRISGIASVDLSTLLIHLERGRFS
jgi:hypothetical protein